VSSCRFNAFLSCTIAGGYPTQSLSYLSQAPVNCFPHLPQSSEQLELHLVLDSPYEEVANDLRDGVADVADDDAEVGVEAGTEFADEDFGGLLDLALFLFAFLLFGFA
jgi:hypothetical protein